MMSSNAWQEEREENLEESGQMEAEVPSSLKDEYEELNNRYLRLAADFENFRKRQTQEREHFFKYAAQATLEELLPVLDNLERAKQGLSENSDPKMLYKSFEMLADQLLDTLKTIGLEKSHPQGEIFNPALHEAISQVENPDVPDHTIMDVYQDGYLLYDRVLRPARVVVAVNPQPAPEEKNPEKLAQDSSEEKFEPAKPSEKDKNPFQQTSP